MANLSLSQLRDAQKANPPTDGEWKLNPAWETAPGRFPGPQTPINVGPPAPEGTGETPPPDVSLPIQASTPVSPVPSGAGGFTRIFPAAFASLAHVTPDWKAQNWVGNGPWQHLEGWPAHPDFEANLLTVEQSPEVVGEFPGK